MNEEQRGDFATFGGYLCSLAGEIPAVSDHIVVPDYIFTIVQVRGLFNLYGCVPGPTAVICLSINPPTNQSPPTSTTGRRAPHHRGARGAGVRHGRRGRAGAALGRVGGL